jgi:quinoprotein glucose dehydrogenase
MFFTTNRSLPTLLASMVAVASVELAHAQHELSGKTYPAHVAAASDEGEKAIKRFQLPPGWKCELWAAEPDLAQPVAFYMDDTGKVYVCETFRHSQGVDDIRGHADWLDEELASKTVDDRIALLRRHYNNDLTPYTLHSERVRLLQDTTGLGKATKSTVFAEGFTNVLDGIAAGVLARGDDVYLANIPNLWLLRDSNHDGVADYRRSLSYGYGVRGGFLGHDLHGLTWGPDGKLYFSIGDRAGNVLVDGHYVGNPDSGAVFRCNADGSDLEVFCYGLRNPQELVFDEFGNLFTGDNNSDAGDQARWVYLFEEADNGWRIGYQFLEGTPLHAARGPWNSEKLWAPQPIVPGASMVPPIANISSGPSGVSYYPGTGAPKDFAGTFTLVDFRGSAGGSGIHRFKLKANGASFDLVEADKMIWSILATDGDWGPDSAFYVADWVEGWNQNGKGRIYKITHGTAHADPIVTETKKLLAEGFRGKTKSQLVSLLAHPNQRVRQGAQFQLSDLGPDVLPDLVSTAKSSRSLLARVHAIWGIGQIYTRDHRPGAKATSKELDVLVSLLKDGELEVRANAARVLGNAAYGRAYEGLVQALNDSSPRVVSLATMALGKLARSEAVTAIFEVLKRAADRDPVIRHAAVQALTRCATVEQLAALAQDSNESLRMAAVLTLRRLQRPEVAYFLQDSSEKVVLEAARAINDEPIPGALAALAGLIAHPPTAVPLLSRVINANYRHGTDASAAALAQYAARTDAPELGRMDALDALAAWPKNSGRDRITGLWRATAFGRSEKTPAAALKPSIAGILDTAPDRVRAYAAKAAGDVQLGEAAPALGRLVANRQTSGEARLAALRALAELHSSELPEALAKAADDPDENVRKAALTLSAQTASSGGGTSALQAGSAKPAGGSDALTRISDVINKGTLAEKQSAFATVAGIEGQAADAFLGSWMKQLLDGKVAPELQLDVLDAASKRPALKTLVDDWEAKLPKNGTNDISAFKICLTGGDAAEGKKVFLERAEVSCVRCHKISGEGGEVGPELTGVVSRKNREYVLQSIIYPNAEIAQGFESVLVTMKNGATYAGVVKSETADQLQLNSPEDGLLNLKRSDITAREKGLSGMPEGFGSILSKQDLRNLVEFLATAK